MSFWSVKMYKQVNKIQLKDREICCGVSCQAGKMCTGRMVHQVGTKGAGAGPEYRSVHFYSGICFSLMTCQMIH